MQSSFSRTFAAQTKDLGVSDGLRTPTKDDRSTYDASENVMAHAGLRGATAGTSSGGMEYLLFQPIYSKEYVESVKPSHLPPKKLYEKVGFYGVQAMRSMFDLATGYGHQRMTEKQWLRRILFLETVAGVPGFVGGMLRHMRSLRTMKRDRGWIHTLLEEAENEASVFLNFYLLAYTISPRTSHSFVGYLEEEAVKTYTRCIEDLDAGKIPEWTDKPVPTIALKYWQLGPDATMRDLLLAVRADEACHSHVNHAFAHMKPTEENPFVAGTMHVP